MGPGDFHLRNVEVAGSFAARLRGLMGRPPTVLLLRTSSVHGFWIREPLRVVGIDRQWRVLRVAVLGRCHIVRMPGAHWVLETPLGDLAPEAGDQLHFEQG